MKLTTTLPLIALLATPALTTDTPTSTLTIHPACPSAAPVDETVTRAPVDVPSCAAGNETKPMIISVSDGVTMTGGGAMMTPTMGATGMPPLYTGTAAARKGVLGGVWAVGGAVAVFVV